MTDVAVPDLGDEEWKKIAPNERRDICDACEYLLPPFGNCQKCGCFVKLKAIFRSQACPENKWPVYGLKQNS